ncbi:MAG: ABC transporter ATP-binding protein [Burkholderiales bacterium]
MNTLATHFDLKSLAPHPAPRLSVFVRRKVLGNRVVLRDVGLHVGTGEIVAVLGASGCGKSTLLRTINGLDADSDAEVEIRPSLSSSAKVGKQADVDARGASIGMVYQEPRLMPWLPIRDNVRFGAPASIVDAHVDAILNEVGLLSVANALPKTLSGGMAQRVAIARALVREPSVLLMDEPFSALDVLTRRSLQRLTRSLTQQHGTATVIVTHDPDEAVGLADRVLVLAQAGPEAGATVRCDLRPAVDTGARASQVEAIIAALENTSHAPQPPALAQANI